ncbi:hypothetical protein TI04_03385 [Achromatium sp. WMS2]|nr:hypothetical protein TI04_03385 [Achromatium sp. WMS2]
MYDIEQELKDLNGTQEHIQKQWKNGQQRILKFIVKLIPKLLNVESCSVFIQDPNRGKVWLVCATDLDAEEIEVPKRGSLVGEVITSGIYQIRTDMDKQPGMHKITDHDTGFVTKSVLCIPVKGSTTNMVIGAIQILNKHDNQEYTEEDRMVLEEMANYLQLLMEYIFLGQKATKISEKVRKKIAFVDIMLKLWGVLMVGLIVGVTIYMLPILIKGF